MKTFNLFNQSFWTGGSPNQTGETQSRDYRIGGKSWLNRGLMLLITILTLGVGQAWADLWVQGYGGWSNQDGNKMTGSGPWTFTQYWESGGNFKIHDGSNYIGSPNCNGCEHYLLSFNTEVSLSYNGGSNMYFSVPTGGGVYKITVRNDNGYKLTVEKLCEEESGWVTIAAPKVYWNNTNATYSNVSIINGRYTTYGQQGIGSISYPLTHIENTQLWYNVSISNNAGDAQKYTTTLFVNGNWGGDWDGARASYRAAVYATSYTASSAGDVNSDTYLYYADSGSKNATLHKEKQTGGYSDLNKTQTIKVYLKETTDGSYTNQTTAAGWKGTFTPNRYYLSDETTATNVSATDLTPGSNVTVSAVITSAFSLTESSTADGYTFDGWGTSEGDTPSGANAPYSISSISGENTIYAFFSANTYGVTLDMNGGTVSGSATATYYQGMLDITTAATPATGYHVIGYYDGTTADANLVATTAGVLQPNVSGLTDENGKWVATEDKTLYAKWSNEYTVTLDDDDATIHGTANVTATYGSAMPSITIPRKTGYLFGGYFADLEDPSSKYYDENGVSAKAWYIDRNETLHAKWNGISYTVSFDPNGGMGTIADQNLTYGTAENLTENNSVITRDGYYFLGWNTEADGSGTKYYDHKSVSAMTTSQGAIVTLYAQWAKKHTLYFLNMGTSSWNQGGSAGATTRYAYAFITYDGYEMHPLGTWTNNGPQGTAMTAVDAISLPNVSGVTSTWCWSIDNVPEGATIIFSDNNKDHKTGDLSGWTAEKPYYCNGNGTWYALDGTNEITKMTNWSVHIGKGHFGDSWQYFALDKYDDGTYAKIWLNTDQTYQYKYSNWVSGGGESGSPNNDAYIINGGGSVDAYGPWTLNGDKNVLVKTNTHASGQYKFSYEGLSSTSPVTKLYVPRGVNLTTTNPTEAKKGEQVTISFTADAWTNISGTTAMTNPTYYFQFSTDNSNWTTVATVSNPTPSTLQATAEYTFNAKSGYFRVKLVNDHGLASYSGSTAFTAYTTKSFYVYNPWYDENWSTLHLYTWNDAGSKPTYNGSFPGHDSGNCEHGNAIENKGNGWYYITIDERADKFQLVGNETYNDHKTEDCSVSNYIQDAKYMIKTVSSINKVIEYEAKGSSDFRLKYTYGTPSKTLYSPIYNTDLDGTTITTSMWMDASQTSTLYIEQANGDNSWASPVATYSSETAGIGGLIDDSEHRDHGYVFTMKLNTSTPSVSDVEEYTGSFYVRTDGLDGGWNKYQKADHMMNNSKASLDGTPAYDYYLCKWVGTPGTNVKFTIANDYNPELVASLEGDATEGDPLYGRQTVPDATNVRFAWNSRTNTLTRAYLSGASAASSRFLVLVETGTTGKIYNASGSPLTTGEGRVDGLNEHELLFEDNGNWVYQLDMMANPDAQAKVTAKYNGEEPEFIPTTTLIGGSGSSKYSYRIVYDFKTNILTNAWVADGSQINENIVLNSNVMIIRVGQGNAVQLTFGANKSMSEVEKVYGVMQFNRSTINDESISRYKRDLYWISFPFAVELKDAFGMGEYGTHWIIEYYDGQGRAAHGFWADSEPNWKFVTPAMRDNYTLKANEGYILALDLDELGSTSPVWENGVNETFLYFPSKDNIGNIQATTAKVDLGNPADYQCIINRGTAEGDRRIKDSYWHCIGVPSYANVLDDNVTDSVSRTVVWNASSLPFLYQWKGYSTGENTLEVVSTSSSDFTFKPMYSYLVQYNLRYMHWSAVTNNASVAARLTETPDKEYALTLNYGDTEQDKAMLRLTDNDGVSNRFEFNYDLSKEYNAGRGNIWTVTADTVEVAGNSMPKPLQTTLVPVGVKVVANGEYTLAMPEGTNGEDVYLIDNAYGTRTNLGLMPYTVTLTAGTYDSRFALEFGPIQDSPTSVEEMENGQWKMENDAVRKVFVGGRLYIIRDGKVYDAAGQRVE